MAGRILRTPVTALVLVPSPLQASRAARRLCDAQGGLLLGPRVTTLEALAPALLAAAGDRRPVLPPLAERLLALEAGEAAGEPLSGLDPNQIVEIRDLIRRLGREKTVILSTHILQEVEAVCQRILILDKGRIVAQGTREEIEGTLKGEVLLDLVLRGPAVLPAALAGIAGVRKVISTRGLPAGATEVRLSLAPDSGAEERLFDWAVAQGLKITAMVPQRLSLEDIFLQLTGGAEYAEIAEVLG